MTGLSLDTVLPLVSVSATNEEKIAGLLALAAASPPLLNPDDPKALLQVHATLDYAYLRRLLKARGSSKKSTTDNGNGNENDDDAHSYMHQVALTVLAALATHPEIASSSPVRESLLLVVQSAGTPVSATERSDAIDVLARLVQHRLPDVAAGILASAPPLAAAWAIATPQQKEMLHVIIVASVEACGARLPTLTPLLVRLRQSVSPSDKAAVADTATIRLMSHILDAVPAVVFIDDKTEEDDPLDLAPLITHPLRARGAPLDLHRRSLRLAAAAIPHYSSLLTRPASTWIVVAGAAAVDLAMQLDALDAACAIPRDLDALAAACVVLETQVSALAAGRVPLDNGPGGSEPGADALLTAWQRHAGVVLGAAGAWLAGFADLAVATDLTRNETPQDHRPEWLCPAVQAVARVVCQLLCEGDDDGDDTNDGQGSSDDDEDVLSPEAAKRSTGGRGVARTSSSARARPGRVARAVFPLVLALATTRPSSPSATETQEGQDVVAVPAMPWAAACLARLAASPSGRLDAAAQSQVAAALAHALHHVAAVPGWDTITHLSAALLTALLTTTDGDSSAASADRLARDVAGVAAAYTVAAPAAIAALAPAAAQTPQGREAATAAATVLAYACMALRVVVSAPVHATMTATADRDAATAVLGGVADFAEAAWASGLVGGAQEGDDDDLGNVLHLALDPTAEMVQRVPSVRALWRSVTDMRTRRSMLVSSSPSEAAVPEAFAREAQVLGLGPR
ncbi:hypothetical protein BC828DRAFT_438450 [Blastocladiella britannica]|nr:hypothetical protein BC828DRAFT_438450 [Blastocladiella britannica]